MESKGDFPAPILCTHLLRNVDARLVELLGSLRADEWDLATVAPEWRVRDVTAHLLDSVLRKLSLARDRWSVEEPSIRSPQDLAALVNRLNREGVTVFRRLSPSVLISLMSHACRESALFHESLDPFAPAVFAVSWAGQERSLNWFDTARELTERWHHQQQIRHAIDRPGLMIPELYHPVLDCFLRGLPHAYRRVEAEPGTVVCIEVSGDCGGVWQIEKGAADWALVRPVNRWDSRIVVPQEIAWRVFTRGIPRAEAEKQVHLEGNREIGIHVLQATAIVA
jgi:uncharacterized protein (TIGR03083 family)